MAHCGGHFIAPCALALVLAGVSPVLAANPEPPPSPPLNGWQFSFTPYGWAISINGNATARGHTTDINDNFFQIIEKSDSMLAWMSYFEARKGPFALFTDVVWPTSDFPVTRMTISTGRCLDVRSRNFPMWW